MAVQQKTIITGQTESGEEVKFDKDSLTSLTRATTTEGESVLVVPDSMTSQEVFIHVEFDDILENNTKKTLDWKGEDVPDDAWRVVFLTFFDGSKVVFSHPREAIRFLKQLPPLISPRERDAKVFNIAEYRKDTPNNPT